MRVLTESGPAVLALAFSPDGRWLAVGRSGADAEVWDMAGGGHFAIGGTRWARFLRFADGTLRVASACRSPGAIRVREAELSGAEMQRTRVTKAVPPDWRGAPHGTHAFPIHTLVALLPDGRVISHEGRRLTCAGAGGGGWEVEVGAGCQASLAPGGDRLLTADPSTGLVVWQWLDAETGTPLGGILPTAAVGRLTGFSPDGTRVLTVSGPAVTVWDQDTARREVTLDVRDAGELYAAVFSPDVRILALGGDDGLVRLWRPEVWRPGGSLDFGFADGVTILAFASDGSLGAAGGDDGRLVVWDAD